MVWVVDAVVMEGDGDVLLTLSGVPSLFAAGPLLEHNGKDLFEKVCQRTWTDLGVFTR